MWPSCKVFNNEAVGLLIKYDLSLVREGSVAKFELFQFTL